MGARRAGEREGKATGTAERLPPHLSLPEAASALERLAGRSLALGAEKLRIHPQSFSCSSEVDPASEERALILVSNSRSNEPLKLQLGQVVKSIH